MTSRLRLAYLADHAAAVTRVAGWLHEQWFRAWGMSPEETAEELRGRLNRSRLPLTLVALDRGEPVGTASLIKDRVPYEAEALAFLTGVYVRPDRRGRGLGRRLCLRALAEARRLGLTRLGLYTTDREVFYARLGWQPLGYVLAETGADVAVATFMARPVEPFRPGGLSCDPAGVLVQRAHERSILGSPARAARS